MATYYWIGGTGNWSDGTKWSTSSGGSAANATPTTADDVVFDNNSAAGTFTVTVDAAADCANFTVSITNSARKMTLARSAVVDLSVYGTWLNATAAYFAWSGSSGTLVFKSTATGKTITPNGLSIPTAVTFDGVGGGWTLGGALSVSTSGTNITLLNGALSLGGFNVSASAVSSSFVCSGSGTCSLDATGSPTLTFATAWNVTNANFSFTKGTSQITMTTASAAFTGAGLTYHNISFTNAGASALTINGANTFNNVSCTVRSTSGIGSLTINANQTINGSLNAHSGVTDPTKRLLITSDVAGTARTLTCAAISSACIDLRDITIAGAVATYDASAVYWGDCGGNSGVTFPTPKTVYWGATLSGSNNWYANGWATTSGGSGANANFPLAQDTAIIDESSACTTLTFITGTWNVGTIDCSARTTTAVTIAGSSAAPAIHGDLTLSSKVTISGTAAATFFKRGTQIVTSAGRTITWPTTFNAIGGTVRFADNATFSATAGVTLTNGTLDLNSKTASVVLFTSAGSASRTLAFGTSGALTVTGSGASAFVASGSNLTTSGTGKIALSSASAKTFDGGGFSYSGINLSQEGAGALTIVSSNTLGDITNTTAGYGSTVSITSGTTQTVENFTLSGTTGNRITLTATAAAAATLSKASGAIVVSSLNISKSTATGGATWTAPINNDNVNGGTNTGWLFIYNLVSSAGSFVLTGKDATLARQIFLSSSLGTFTFTGENAGLLVSKLLDATPASYAFNGLPAELVYAFILHADKGAFSLSGRAAAFHRNYVLSPTAGSITLLGKAASLRRLYPFAPETGAYVLTLKSATGIFRHYLSAGAGSFALAGGKVVVHSFNAADPETVCVPAEMRISHVYADAWLMRASSRKRVC